MELNINESRYLEDVIEYLEYLNYPEYVTMFEPAQVAKSIGTSAMVCCDLGVSPRYCALIIFGLTFTTQIYRDGKRVH